MKRLVLAAAAALVLGSAAPSPVRADDTATAPANAIQWIEGWSAGREAAKNSGKLMLVYVHRTKPG